MTALPNDATSALRWPPAVWTELLRFIRDGSVIPIIGPDLLQMPLPDGTTLPLERYLARELAARLELTDSAGPDPTLNEVVCAHLAQKGSEGTLRPVIEEILDQARFEPPPALIKLAQIRPFSLFISTTFDSFLERALNQVRYDGKPVTKRLVYSTRGTPPDLPRKKALKQALPEATVYYLLGILDSMPTWVLSEEDLLEFVRALQSSDHQPALLFDSLEENHLLFLGENFPDWLARIFLRTTKRDRLSGRRDTREFVADSVAPNDPGLLRFLRNFSTGTRIVPSAAGGAVEFVNELHQRWMEKYPTGAVPDEERSGAPAGGVRLVAEPGSAPDRPRRSDVVLVSYFSADKAAAITLRDGLKAAGVNAVIDEDFLKHGARWREVLQETIRTCACFIPVLSMNAEAKDEGEFRDEWHQALTRQRKLKASRRFICPVVIDGDPERRQVHAREDVRQFKDLHVHFLRDGQIDPAFAESLVEAVRAVVGP